MPDNKNSLTVVEDGKYALVAECGGKGYTIDLSRAETAFVERMLSSEDTAIFMDVLGKAATAGYRRHKSIMEDEG